MNRRKTTKTMWSTARPIGLFAVAVFALSAGAPLPVHSAENRAAIEASDAKMAGLVGPLMNEAISLFRAGKYEQALLKCNEIDKVFATQKFLASSQVTAQKSMIAQLRSEIQTRWANFMANDLRKVYSEAERLLFVRNNPKSAKNESEKDPSYCEQRAIAHFKYISNKADKIAVQFPFMKSEVLTLKAAAQKQLSSPTARWGLKSAQESARREAFILKKINPLCQDAVKLLKQKSFKRAYAKWVDASKLLKDQKFSDSPKMLELRSQLIALRREILRQWEMAYVMEIRAGYVRAAELAPKDPKQALAIARGVLNRIVEAKAELPVPSKTLAEFETACNKLVKSEEFIGATSLASIEEAQDLSDRRSNIQKLLIKGETYYRNKMYSKARDTYEQVYILDPFNEQANIMLGKIYRKIVDTAWMRRENEILERINEVEWKWVLPSRQTTEDPLDETPVQDETTTERASIYRKLQDISYPGADFEDENVSDVFALIQRRSRELDPEKKGISIFYPQFKDDKFVTLKMGPLPIGELIRYVCMYAGLKYKITHQGVVIGDSTLDDMRVQTFTMSNTLYDTITGVGTGETKNLLAEEGNDNPFGDDDNKGAKPAASAKPAAGNADAGTTTAGSDALKNFFIECGIPFGEGSGISYSKISNKLTVKNTPENLRTIATLLEKIDVETELVLVEAKIIEISVTDLEELGFDWTLTHNNTDPEFLFGNATQTDSTFGSAETFQLGEAVINQVLVRHTGGGGSGGNFSTEDAIGALNLINNLNIIPNFGKDGAYNMFLTVHAVDQSARGEVIAAPKVLAKSGSAATIQMVQQMYFPEDWEEAELEEGNNTFEYTPPVPEMGDAQPIGTNFTVTPTVSTNLRTITLVLSPSITALVGWTDYDYQFIIGSIRSVSSTSNVYAAKMKMPEISERSLSTQLKIYDGDTVVLGGVLQEQSMKRDDKYPFLGEIPLVGTLFSNKASRSVKQNLLIFVTPRLIGYNGVPVNAVPDKGRFDFNR
ncbi:MAG: hypothetical protein IJW23_06190 [Lentisphaeria bacterium]|nr:hypothetical protein [Lentisphaeria bacterium]